MNKEFSEGKRSSEIAFHIYEQLSIANECFFGVTLQLVFYNLVDDHLELAIHYFEKIIKLTDKKTEFKEMQNFFNRIKEDLILNRNKFEILGYIKLLIQEILIKYGQSYYSKAGNYTFFQSPGGEEIESISSAIAPIAALKFS